MKVKEEIYIQGVKQEQNKFKRAGIWLWYNDWFRIIFIMLGVWWLIPLMLYLRYLGMSQEDSSDLICGLYLLIFFIGMVFNDYSNLRRIGMNEYRRKLK